MFNIPISGVEVIVPTENVESGSGAWPIKKF